MLNTKKRREKATPLEAMNKKKKLFIKKPARGGMPARARRARTRVIL